MVYPPGRCSQNTPPPCCKGWLNASRRRALLYILPSDGTASEANTIIVIRNQTPPQLHIFMNIPSCVVHVPRQPSRICSSQKNTWAPQPLSSVLIHAEEQAHFVHAQSTPPLTAGQFIRVIRAGRAVGGSSTVSMQPTKGSRQQRSKVVCHRRLVASPLVMTGLAALHRLHCVVVPGPLQPALVHARDRFLPHGRCDKVGHRSRRRVLLRGHLLR